MRTSEGLMKQIVLLVLLESLPAFQLEAKDRGHTGGGGLAPFRPRATIGQGIGGHGIRGQGGFGFGFGRRGFGARRSWPLFGSGLGIYYSEYNTPSLSGDYDASPDSGNPNSPTTYYYQKPEKQDLMPNCKDSWATRGSTSSLGNFMNRVFELQCQNRHPEAEAKPSPAAPAAN